MNITVNVSDVTLDTVVAEVFGYDSETGDPYEIGNKTIADLVTEQIMTRVTADDRYKTLAAKVAEIRTEVIREAVRPQIDEAIAAPVQKTNSYGELVGEPTTLRALIVEEARKAVNEPIDKYARDKGTYLTRAVAAEVKKAIDDEVAGAVKQVREQFAGQIGERISEAVTSALRTR